MPSKFGNARAQSDPRGEIAPAVRPSSDKAELRTVDKAKDCQRAGSRAYSVQHRREYRIRIYVVTSNEDTKSIQRHCKIVIHAEEEDYPFFDVKIRSYRKYHGINPVR